jgi:hypothetical protein
VPAAQIRTAVATLPRSTAHHFSDNSGTIPTAFGAGFAAGSSGVALRGLTVNSTLVLIDGRRAAPYAIADGPASVTLSTYYTSGFQSTSVDAKGDPTICLYTTNYCHVASFIDIDLTGIYKVTSQLTASLTVQKLMDRLPPINPADYAGVNYNPTYAQSGIIGRFLKFKAS